MAFDYRSTLICTAEELMAVGKTTDAIFQLQRLVSNFPDDVEAHQRLGDGYLKSGQYHDAKKSYDTALTLNPGHVLSLVGIAEYYWKCGKIDVAKDLLIEINNSKSDDAKSYMILAQIELGQRNIKESLACFGKAAQIEPNDVHIQKVYGKFLHSVGDWATAEKVLMHAATLTPPDPGVFCLLAQIHFQKGQTDSALEFIRQSLSIRPPTAEITEHAVTIISQAHGSMTGLCVLQQYLESRNDASVEVIRSALRKQISNSLNSHKKAALKRNPKLVVFVGRWPRTRHAKLSYGLRRAGWQTVLLCSDTLGNDFSSYFDEIRYFKDDLQAVSLASTYSPQAYHAFSIWSDSSNTALIRHKPGKVVYDCLDVVEGINGGEYALASQKYCIENADALCCRDMRFQYLKRMLNYNLPEKLILFPDYCWNNSENPFPQKQLVKEDGEFHIVVCGSIDVEKMGQTEGVYLDFARTFAQQGVHLHIYPAQTHQLSGASFDDIFSDYIELQETTPFFHLHKTIPHEQVIPTISQYDVGSLLNHSLVYNLPLERYEPFQLNLSLGSRVFDYLDAGLPVLTHKLLGYQYFFMNRHGLALHITPRLLSNFKVTLKSFLSSDLQPRIQRARENYDICRQIGRLTALYEAL